MVPFEKTVLMKRLLSYIYYTEKYIYFEVDLSLPGFYPDLDLVKPSVIYTICMNMGHCRKYFQYFCEIFQNILKLFLTFS